MTDVGDRIKLVFTDDEHTNLEPGDEGTVTFIDSTGTVFADWDNGSKLGLNKDFGDEFVVVS